MFCIFITTAHWVQGNVTPFCHVLYRHAVIHTMNQQQPTASAMLSDCGRLQWVGENSQADAYKRWYTKEVDLSGTVVLPGFIDSHSHFPLVGLNKVSLNLNPPPDGSVDSLDALYNQIKSKTANTPTEDWIFGFNYDNTVYEDGQHPDRYALDAVAPDHPVFVRHNSGHMGVANSIALNQLNIDDDEQVDNPNIGRYSQDGKINGLLQESAAPKLTRFIKDLSFSSLLKLRAAAIEEYASAGYTTVQAGGIDTQTARLFSWASRLKLIPLRLHAWVHAEDLPERRIKNTDGFSVGAIKLYADGSPQGYTAYLSEPYYSTLGNDADYRGRPLIPAAHWSELFERFLSQGWSIAIHTNGDAAIDDVLSAVKSLSQTDASQWLTRTASEQPAITLVHAQVMRQDQVKLAAELGVSSSFFVTHTYYWGDWHDVRALGPERAKNISPLAWADQEGLRYTIHSDAPVTSPSGLQLIWSATQRETTNGRILGAHQRVSRQRAIQTLTSDAAWQAGLAKSRGSLVAGKLTDFIVFDEDPYTVNDVRDLKVLRTVVDGKTVFSR